MASQSSVTTIYRRIMLTKITSGAIAALPKITHIAFGDGGVDHTGKVVMPAETQTALQHEFCRYPVAHISYPVATTARYTVVIPKEEQAGALFSEMGLIDAAGKLCAIKNMRVKEKDEDVIFTFEFDDEF